MGTDPDAVALYPLAGEVSAARRRSSAVVRLCAYLWALPSSLIGLLLLIAGGGLVRGRAAIVDGVIEASGPWIRWGLRHLTPLEGGAAAITFGHVVLGLDARALEWTRSHERAHVRQYERWGPLFIPAYVIASGQAWLRGDDPYCDNPFEREARLAEACFELTQAR